MFQEPTITKKMVRQFLTPPRIGRQFTTEDKNAIYTWEIVQIIRKMSHIDFRYEVVVSLISKHSRTYK